MGAVIETCTRLKKQKQLEKKKHKNLVLEFEENFMQEFIVQQQENELSHVPIEM